MQDKYPLTRYALKSTLDSNIYPFISSARFEMRINNDRDPHQQQSLKVKNKQAAYNSPLIRTMSSFMPFITTIQPRYLANVKSPNIWPRKESSVGMRVPSCATSPVIMMTKHSNWFRRFPLLFPCFHCLSDLSLALSVFPSSLSV